MPERIQLISGNPGWLLSARFALVLVAALNILFCAISPGWKMALMVALALVLLICPSGIGSRIEWCMRSDGTLASDGKSEYSFRVVERSAWLSRWVSVFRIRDMNSGKVRTCVVPATLNHQDDYRRMLVFLRMRPERKEGITVW
jgi:hypothetical protein